MISKREVKIGMLAAVLGFLFIFSTTVAASALAPTVTSFGTAVSGLNNPRGLAFSDGNLYVAETGEVPGNNGTGNNGAILVVHDALSSHPTTKTLVSGLPTYCNPAEGCIGVGGISVLGETVYAIVGSAPQITHDDEAGQLLKIDQSGHVVTVANVGKFDYEWAMDHQNLVPNQFPDSNPYAVLALHDHIYVVDAGTNVLDEVMPNGQIHVLAFFPNEKISDAVPTCVAQGPDGLLYVGTLALVDSFVLGPSAKVYRVDPSQANLADPAKTPMSVWAQGLFPINGCAFGPGGNFFASELFTNPSHNETVVVGNPQGDVVKIPMDNPSKHISLTHGALLATAGVVVGSEWVLVSSGTVFVPPGGGTVVRINR